MSLSLTSIPANGVAQSTITVTVKDALNKPVANQNVTVTRSGDVTLSPASGPTNANGQFFSKATASTTPGTETITGRAGTVSGTATLTETTQVAQRATATLQYPRSSPNGVSRNTVTVRVLDAAGNGVPGMPVTMSAGGGITFAPQSGTTNASGSFATASIASHTPGTATLTATVPTVTAATAQLTLAWPRLWTSGAQILDDRGPVKLQGVQISPIKSTAVSPTDDRMATLELDPIDVSAFPYIADPAVTNPPPGPDSWKLNTVRFFLNDVWWFSRQTPCSEDGVAPGSRYRSLVNGVVRQLTDEGLIVIVGLGSVTWGSGAVTPPCLWQDTDRDWMKKSSGYPYPWAMADEQNAINFWHDVATMFADDPLVAFDLYNEPNLVESTAGTQDKEVVWHDGGLVTGPSSGPFQSAGMQEMFNEAHAAAPNNLIIVSGYGPTYDPTDLLSKGGTAGGYDVRVALDHPILEGSTPAPQVVYSSHPYKTGSSGNNCLNALRDQPGPDDLQKIVDSIRNTYPLIFGEFGTNCPDVQKGQDNQKGLIQFTNTNGIDGWNVFAWYTTFNGCAPNDYNKSFGILFYDGVDGCPTNSRYDPNKYGEPVQDEALANPRRLD